MTCSTRFELSRLNELPPPLRPILPLSGPLVQLNWPRDAECPEKSRNLNETAWARKAPGDQNYFINATLQNNFCASFGSFTGGMWLTRHSGLAGNQKVASSITRALPSVSVEVSQSKTPHPDCSHLAGCRLRVWDRRRCVNVCMNGWMCLICLVELCLTTQSDKTFLSTWGGYLDMSLFWSGFS